MKVGHAKARSRQARAMYAPEREKRIFQRLARLNGGPLRPQHVRTIFREVISSCLALEQPLRIAYLGPAGTYSQQAAADQFGSGAALLPLASIDTVFDEVEHGPAEFGVVPVENSTEGVVAQTLDRFISSPLAIKAEVAHGRGSCGADVIEQVSGPAALDGIDADLNAISDTAPTLAALAPFARAPVHIRNVCTLAGERSIARRGRRAGAPRRAGRGARRRPDRVGRSPPIMLALAATTMITASRWPSR